MAASAPQRSAIDPGEPRLRAQNRDVRGLAFRAGARRCTSAAWLERVASDERIQEGYRRRVKSEASPWVERKGYQRRCKRQGRRNIAGAGSWQLARARAGSRDPETGLDKVPSTVAPLRDNETPPALSDFRKFDSGESHTNSSVVAWMRGSNPPATNSHRGSAQRRTSNHGWNFAFARSITYSAPRARRQAAARVVSKSRCRCQY
jgi:hypothetical protein